MAEITSVPVTSISTEQGCPYGRELAGTIGVLRASSESKIQRAADNVVPFEFIQQNLDQQSEKATVRLTEVQQLQTTLDACANCHGTPEGATMSKSEVCPVAKYAIYKMTLPGNAGLDMEHEG